MNNTDKKLEKYFNSLGYTLFEIKGSVYREEKSTFVFQTDNKYHTVDCSTILYDHAVKIYQAIAEERERVVREISKIRIEMDSRKTFNCVKKTDVHGFCCDAHLGEADANTKWGQALSSLDTNPK